MSTEKKFGSLTTVADTKIGVSGSTSYVAFFGTSGGTKQVVGTLSGTAVTADVVSSYNTLVTALKTYGLI